MECEFNTLTHGSSHTSPSANADIQMLEASYREAGLHELIPGRKPRVRKDKATDMITKGVVKLHSKWVMKRWQDSRQFERSQEEDWEPLSDGNGE